ncbi:hypothetical protein [Microbacterium awajiense]|uniref:hypothetical protein n=1 Tax=Microbacterium awajiense TaxID=415214 RepID=UPI0031DE1905
MRDYYLANTSPGGLIVLTSEHLAPLVKAAVSSDAVRGALPRRLARRGSLAEPVLAFVRASGAVDGLSKVTAELADPRFNSEGEFVSWMFAEGLSQLLHDSDAVHRGTSSFHFKTPSGSHQSQFIVVGEAYHNYARSGFAALAIWHQIGGGPVDEVLIDTASLGSVGYAVAILGHQLGNESSLANVRSFRGHAAPREAIDRWASNPGALFIISASSSGELADRIGASPRGGARAVSMYYLGTAQPPANTICDLRSHGNSGDGEDILPTEAHRGLCTLCDLGSALLEIAGDSLFPATPQTAARKIGLPDRPPWVKEHGATLFSRGLFQLNSATAAGSRRTIHFDLSRGLANEQVAAILAERLIAESDDLPDLIVHANDDCSRNLAGWWREQTGVDGIPLVRQEGLRSLAESGAERVTVFCSVVASGRSVNEISRALRDVAPRAIITYCIGMVRTWSTKRWANLESDLRIARGGRKHDVRIGFMSPLPPDHEPLIDPWGYEATVWERLVLEAESLGLEDLARGIDARLAEVLTGSFRVGAFLPHSRSDSAASTTADNRLRLTEGFAFWDRAWAQAQGFNYSDADDADVFVTVASLLNRARTEPVEAKDGPLPLLTVDAHNRVVIDPFAFNRFTDGLVQAALLRAAIPRELDYSASRALSRDIASVVGLIVEQSGTDDGAASHEFLLAIAGGRLRMREPDLRSVIHRALTRASRMENGELLRLLAIACEQRPAG